MRYALVTLVVLSLSSITTAADWLTMPGTFSHDATGARVSQYAPIAAPAAPSAPNFRTSGYTHTRSSLNYGQSADNYHRVESWGDPVRPYGEWRFPYRPYSTPYPNWGAPFAGFNVGPNFYGPGFNGSGINGSGWGGAYGPGNGSRFGPGHRGGPSHQEGPGHAVQSPQHRPGPSGHGDAWQRGRWPSTRSRQSLVPQNPLLPYQAGPGTPYPAPPYYDGYFPAYQQ